MAINIDNFLEKYDSKDVRNEKDPKNEYDANITFQKDVEDRLETIRKDMNAKDFELIKTVYDKIKEFDQDLPNKFFGIERKSSLTLKDLGTRYSTGFYQNAKEQGRVITENINHILAKIDAMLESRQYSTILRELETVKDLYHKFPAGFGKEKLQLGIGIRQREIKIFQAIEKYKTEKISEVRKKLVSEVESLKNCMRSQDSLYVERTLGSLENYLSQIPKIILSDLSEERKKIAMMMIKVEEHLDQIYVTDFENKRNELYKLFSEYQKSYLKKELKQCATIYDRILIEFNKMPDIFLEEKMKIYLQINEIYSTMNNLVLNSNVTVFLEAYRNSKAIEEIKDFIDHVKNTGHVEPENLDIAKKKIEELPAEFKEERENLKKELIRLLSVEPKNKESSKSLPKPENLDTEKEINLLYSKIKESNNVVDVQENYNKILKLFSELKLTEEQKQALVNKVESVYNLKLNQLK